MTQVPVRRLVPAYRRAMGIQVAPQRASCAGATCAPSGSGGYELYLHPVGQAWQAVTLIASLYFGRVPRHRAAGECFALLEAARAYIKRAARGARPKLTARGNLFLAPIAIDAHNHIWLTMTPA